jgi:hypothetical protein
MTAQVIQLPVKRGFRWGDVLTNQYRGRIEGLVSMSGDEDLRVAWNIALAYLEPRADERKVPLEAGRKW